MHDKQSCNESTCFFAFFISTHDVLKQSGQAIVKYVEARISKSIIWQGLPIFWISECLLFKLDSSFRFDSSTGSSSSLLWWGIDIKNVNSLETTDILISSTFLTSPRWCISSQIIHSTLFYSLYKTLYSQQSLNINLIITSWKWCNFLD